MNRFFQVLVALLPVVLTPVLVFVLAEGWVDLGGGEKDILMTLPWLIWSVIFAMTSFVMIYRNRSFTRWLFVGFVTATGVLFTLWLIAYVTSSMGIA